MKISAVISTWNKKDAVAANIDALRAGDRAPDEIVVVDNASSDGTGALLRERYPDVVLVEMPHDRFGACETFNRGFWAAGGDIVLIMDDDVEVATDWLSTLERLMTSEPDTTAMISSRVVEPGMPAGYQEAEVARGSYYASTFRGCGTMARADVLRATGGYDERFFIYGNERDLAARVLARGFRILQTPDAVLYHQTPFGMKAGKRSLYYHVRNFWLYAFKNCTWGDVFRAAWAMARKGLGGAGAADKTPAGSPSPASATAADGGGVDATARRDEAELEATGTMGLAQSIRETQGGYWIVIKATLNALLNLPYCLARRAPVRAPDFKVPGL